MSFTILTYIFRPLDNEEMIVVCQKAPFILNSEHPIV